MARTFQQASQNFLTLARCLSGRRAVFCRPRAPSTRLANGCTRTQTAAFAPAWSNVQQLRALGVRNCELMSVGRVLVYRSIAGSIGEAHLKEQSLQHDKEHRHRKCETCRHARQPSQLAHGLHGDHLSAREQVHGLACRVSGLMLGWLQRSPKSRSRHMSSTQHW